MKPTAAPAHFPYPHRTMAEIMANEAEFEAFLERLVGAGYDWSDSFVMQLREIAERDGAPDMRRLRQEAHIAANRKLVEPGFGDAGR